MKTVVKLAALPLIALSMACASSPNAQGDSSGVGAPGPDADPCAGRDLPPCPPACSGPVGELAGKECAMDGEKCGNEIGDGCSCTGGKWECAPHAPLGGPGACNRVCK